MFKRYKSPFDPEGSSSKETMTREGSGQVSTQTPSRSVPYKQETSPSASTAYAPPRIFDEMSPSQQSKTSQNSLHSSSDKNDEDFYCDDLLKSQEPNTVLGSGVEVKGHLTFQGLLRIDGHFEGELLSDEGKLILGPSGVVRSDSDILLGEAIVEGCIRGNICVTDRIEIRPNAKIIGNIEARAIVVDEGAEIDGKVRVICNDRSKQAAQEKVDVGN